MRFSKDTDYYRAMHLLSEAGCPLTAAANPYTDRPQSRPLSSASTVVNSFETPAPRASLELVHPKIYHSRNIVAGNVSNVPSIHTQCEERNHVTENGTVLRQLRSPIQFERPTQPASSLATLNSANQNQYSDPITNSSVGNALYVQRPYTAPVMRNQGSISKMLPPRRELPFKKPISRSTTRKVLPISEESDPLAASALHSLARSSNISVHTQATGDKDENIAEAAGLKKRTATPSIASTKRSKIATDPKTHSTELAIEDCLQQEPSRAGPLPRTLKARLYACEKTLFSPTAPPNNSEIFQSKMVTLKLPNIPGTILSASEDTALSSTGPNPPTTNKVDNENPTSLPSPTTSRTTTKPGYESPNNAFIGDDTTTSGSQNQEKGQKLAEFEAFLCEQLDNPKFHKLVLDMEHWWPRILANNEVFGGK